MPARPRPIVIIGAGGVVRTAHLPVSQRLNFPVAGLYDINPTNHAKPRAVRRVDRVLLARRAAGRQTLFLTSRARDQMPAC